jgi:hypothetical protein
MDCSARAHVKMNVAENGTIAKGLIDCQGHHTLLLMVCRTVCEIWGMILILILSNIFLQIPPLPSETK